MHFKPNTIQGYKEKDIQYSLITHENVSNSLVIILPGLGVQRPLLHYSTNLFINKSFDILDINYQYTEPFYDDFSMEELTEALKYDVITVIDQVLEDSPYENFYIIGKSLGTIAMSSELKREKFKDAKAVWLTPLLQRNDVFHALVNSVHRGLCIIGDQDPYYIEERYNQLLTNSNLILKLIPKINHSLEYEKDIVGSIEVLKNVITEIEQL